MKKSYLKIAFILLAAFALKNASFAADKAVATVSKKASSVSFVTKPSETASLAVQ